MGSLRHARVVRATVIAAVLGPLPLAGAAQAEAPPGAMMVPDIGT